MGSIGFVWVHSKAPSGRRLPSGLRGFTPPRLVVIGVVGVGVCSLGRASGSLGSFGFEWVHLGGLGIVGFILVRVGSLVLS